jgi:hypothetical protein
MSTPYRNPVQLEPSFEEKVKQALNTQQTLQKQKEFLELEQENSRKEGILQEKRFRISNLEKMVEEVLPSIPDILVSKEFLNTGKGILVLNECNKWGEMKKTFHRQPYLIRSIMNEKIFNFGLECNFEETKSHFDKWYYKLINKQIFVIQFYVQIVKDEKYGPYSFKCQNCHKIRMTGWASHNRDMHICEICEYENESTSL